MFIRKRGNHFSFPQAIDTQCSLNLYGYASGLAYNQKKLNEKFSVFSLGIKHHKIKREQMCLWSAEKIKINLQQKVNF